MMRLTGKVALLTGGGGGIGGATAVRFAEEGARVVVGDINRELGAEVAAKAKEAAGNNGGDAIFVELDVTEHDSVRNVVDTAVDRYGGLHVLYNLAGGSTPEDGSVTEVSDEEFWRCIKLDLFGTFLCCKYGIPAIEKSGGGSVINMSSNVALMAVLGRDSYTAAKGGVAALTRSLAVQYAPGRVRVNAIAPSITLSERVKKFLEISPDLQSLADQHLLGPGQPIHVANMAVYLASDESEITTGQVISVDSGVTIY
ncbi:MAG: SDR family oxidoreductase [Alphaproteobacteria bacterium]|nr:SDR family oxidoreductase [Alphaproteobacteria bacterium]